MGVLEQVMQMRTQGVADTDIVSQLQEEGFAPKSIYDALNQANIKSAVGNGIGDMEQPSQYNEEEIPSPQGQGAPGYPTTQNYEDVYTPQPGGQTEYGSQYGQGEYQEFYQNGGSYEGAGTSADTMVEIAQQVFSEKIRKVQQQLEDLNEFKTLYQTKADSINERLKRIETSIDQLQAAILEKVGAYGSGIESVKKELSMMQDSFGKVMGAATARHHESQQARHPAHHASPKRHSGKKRR